MDRLYSFILPAYKASFFKEAIDSILAQTYTKFELVIVNDASPEDLESILKSYDDSRIRYYENKENIGGKNLVLQWNNCLKYANGEYVILASDDDVYSPLYLEKMNELVEKYPEVNVLRPRIRTIDSDNNTRHIYGYLKERVGMPEFFYSWMTGHIGSAISYYMIKKDALLNHGGFVNFPLAWGSDDATILLLSQYGVAFAQDILFSFRQSGVNISSRRNDSLILKNKLSAYLEFFSWLNRFITNFTSVENDEDEFYITYINKNLPSYFRCVTLLVLSASTPKAILCNVRLIKRLKVISVKDYLITLFHSFVKTLRRSLNLNY